MSIWRKPVVTYEEFTTLSNREQDQVRVIIFPTGQLWGLDRDGTLRADEGVSGDDVPDAP